MTANFIFPKKRNRKQRRADKKMGVNAAIKDHAPDYLHGGGTDAPIHEWVAKAKERLNQDIEEFNGDVEALIATSQFPMGNITSIHALAETRITALADAATSRLKYLVSNVQIARKSLTAFQVAHGISRAPMKVDAPKNMMFLMTTTLLEASAHSVFVLTSGIVSGFAEASGFGVSLAALSTGLTAFVGGNVFSRYWNADTSVPGGKVKRFAARAGAIKTAIVTVGVLGAAAIVRATGDPSALSLSPEVIQTVMSDFQSWLMILVGGVFAILNWRTGLSLSGDPIPGYSEAAASFETAQDALDELVETALDDIEDVFQGAQDDIEDIASDWVEAVEAREANRDALRQSHHDIRTDIEQFSDALAAQISHETNRARILGGLSNLPSNMADQYARELRGRLQTVPDTVPTQEQMAAQANHEAVSSALLLLGETHAAAVKRLCDAAHVPPAVSHDLPGEDVSA